MEEEDGSSSLADVTDSDLQPPQQDSWTTIDHRYINGDQQAVVWGDTEVQIHQRHATDQLDVSPKSGREAPEEAEQWEQVVWPTHAVACLSGALSFATVQWDTVDPCAATPSLLTDSGVANEPQCDDSPDAASPVAPQSVDGQAEPFTREFTGEEDEFDSQLLNCDVELAGSSPEPCDAGDMQEPPKQEKEDSTNELLDSNNEIPLRTDSEEEEEGHSAASDPAETEDLIDSLDETEGSEDEVDSLEDLKLEEEQEELSILLTGLGESEEEHTSANGVETKEVNEVEEELSVTIVSCTEEGEEATAVSSLTDVEVPAEPQQTDDTEPTVNPDKLVEVQQLEVLEERLHSRSEEDVEIPQQLHEDPTGPTEEPEMCCHVDPCVDPKQSEAADGNGEPLIQMADAAERVENAKEIPELAENLEEMSVLQHQDCDQMTSHNGDLSLQSEQPNMTDEPEHIQAEEKHSEDESRQSPQMELREESAQNSEDATRPEEATLSEQTVCGDHEDPGVAEEDGQAEEQPQQAADGPQLQPDATEESRETREQLIPETEVTQQTAELCQVDKQAETAETAAGSGEGSAQAAVANGEQAEPPETAAELPNGGGPDREAARSLARQLYQLDGIQRVDVVKHLDKDNDFSRAVGQEYLKFFDFTGQSLDLALRSFLKVVVLIGETQERERVLQHFACRFHESNPDSFSSSGSVLALTCALMLLNTDLHGQNVGKSMSCSKFVSNLDRMNEGDNFSKDLLKSLYNSIRSEPLEWAVDEEELKGSVLVDEDAEEDAPLRSKSNPFQDVPHDKNASVVKEGFLQRKLHADIDGKRTPWGKRGWKTFYGVLKGMVLYLQKNDYRGDQPTNEEVVSVHHSLAEKAADYTKKPHVFRLQTADWRVFLFQASSRMEMNSWIRRINLVSALHSSPPFPAAVGSQRRFCRPILPASQSAHTQERQLQSHARMLESFKVDLSGLQKNPPEGKKAKAKELEEHRVRAEYLQHEMCRYQSYIQVLEAWKSVEKTGSSVLAVTHLNLFDRAVCADSAEEEAEEEGGLKKSHSSPSLELELHPPVVAKVRRNISERRTYRKTIIPRWNKET